jgi:rubrerythrin
MGARLLPRNLPELFSYSLVLEREAAKRFSELARFLRSRGARRLADEFEKLAREEREQYELIAAGTAGAELPKLAGWELGWYFGEGVKKPQPPRTPVDALAIALAYERSAQLFYDDVAANARADAVRAFAAEMSSDEQRHISQLEELLAHADTLTEPESDDPGKTGDGLSFP